MKAAWMYVYFITYNIPQSSVWWIELVPEQSEKKAIYKGNLFSYDYSYQEISIRVNKYVLD